jgi:hypothetical protein
VRQAVDARLKAEGLVPEAKPSNTDGGRGCTA